MVNLAITMALESLRDQALAVNEADARARQARADRDDLIRDARDAGIGYARITRITGLKRATIYAIVNAPSANETYPMAREA